MFEISLRRLVAACALTLTAGAAAAIPASAASHHSHHRHHHANSIPQHNAGDRDGDNNGAASDGDGNV
jgi:hypothetical protein